MYILYEYIDVFYLHTLKKHNKEEIKDMKNYVKFNDKINYHMVEIWYEVGPHTSEI